MKSPKGKDNNKYKRFLYIKYKIKILTKKC